MKIVDKQGKLELQCEMLNAKCAMVDADFSITHYAFLIAVVDGVDACHAREATK